VNHSITKCHKQHVIVHHIFDDVHFVTRFLEGLKEEIHYIIVLHRPKEMDTASASASASALSFILRRRGLAGVPLARPSLLLPSLLTRRMTQKNI
jgi:hypothetical protein